MAASEVKVIQPHDPNVDRRVIYECNFTVEAAVVQEFCSYLRQHMKEIVGLDDGKLFDRATLCVAENEGLHDAGTDQSVCQIQSQVQVQAAGVF